MDPRLSSRQFVDWIARQSWIAFQNGAEGSVFPVVRQALLTCVEGARRLYFDAGRGELVFEFEGRGRRPFDYLSDGQKCTLALVGDLAQRAVRLNPYLGSRALVETPGIVLIDELELHLHPNWQRSIAASLTRTFPSLQFFCTTHSPQVIGELPHEQVFLLDDRGSYRHPPASKGLDSNEVLEIQDAEPRDRAGLRLQRAFLAALDDLDLHNAERLLAELRGAVEAPSRSISR